MTFFIFSLEKYFWAELFQQKLNCFNAGIFCRKSLCQSQTVMIHRSLSSSARNLLDPVYSAAERIAANVVYRTKRDILHAVVWWLEMAVDVFLFVFLSSLFSSNWKAILLPLTIESICRLTIFLTGSWFIFHKLSPNFKNNLKVRCLLIKYSNNFSTILDSSYFHP